MRNIWSVNWHFYRGKYLSKRRPPSLHPHVSIAFAYLRYSFENWELKESASFCRCAEEKDAEIPWLPVSTIGVTQSPLRHRWLCFTFIFTYPLTAKGRLGTTDDFRNQFPPFLSVLHCPLGLGELQALEEGSLARPDKRQTCPYYFSLRLFTMIKRSSCGLIAAGLPRW